MLACDTIANRPLGSMVIRFSPLPTDSEVPIWLMAAVAGLIENTCTTPEFPVASRNFPVGSTTSFMKSPEMKLDGAGLPVASIR